MRRILLLIVLLSFCLIFSSPVQSATLHYCYQAGNRLVEYWKAYERYDRGTYSEGDLFGNAFYAGYIIGVVDATPGLVNELSLARVTNGQLAAIVGKYLHDHPELWGECAADLVRSAIEKAFSENKPIGKK